MSGKDPAFVFVGLVPHPPVIVPEVGHGRENAAARTVAAMEDFSRRLVAARPDVLVLLSPHSPRRPGAFGFWTGPILQGDLALFSAPQCKVTLPVDDHFILDLRGRASRAGVLMWPIEDKMLDHGAMVPLTYIVKAGWQGRTVVIGLNYPGDGQLELFGELLAATAASQNRRIALVASGDMSHRLTEEAPSGFHRDAHFFDDQFVHLVSKGEFAMVPHIDDALRELAAQDVVESTTVALSAIANNSSRRQVLSYEGPYGVGYCVAILWEASCPEQLAGGETLPTLARRVVEAFVRGEEVSLPDENPSGYLAGQRGIFVTLRRRDGTVRGCLGNIVPTKRNLLQEVHDRAIAVALDAYGTRVEVHELAELSYEVNVLHPPEPVCSIAELDPQVYGVIVRDGNGQRAVLLPGIESVTTVSQQLELVRKKAGVGPDVTVLFEKFRTDHFHEGEQSRTEQLV